MPRATEVPITPDVLRWALEESGISAQDLAKKLKVAASEVEEWLAGRRRPQLSKFRRLASSLHRPTALFLLPSPPHIARPVVQFRRPAGGTVRNANPSELRALRRAAHLQRVLSWVSEELEVSLNEVPRITTHTTPEAAANRIRSWLGVTRVRDHARENPSQTFDSWRAVVEGKGVLVFLSSLGRESCRGFSLWDRRTPVITINTHYREEARVFTLAHELGHLVTRTSSACVDDTRFPKTGGDDKERWCEEFAAGLLLPRAEFVAVLEELLGWQPGQRVTRLDDARTVAQAFRVSLRATVIRMSEVGVAGWDLYEQIPRSSDDKPPQRGGRGRSRRQIRQDQFGGRATQLLVAAVQQELLGRDQAVDYLDIPDAEFDRLSVVPPGSKA